jgi:hypothetical protein
MEKQLLTLRLVWGGILASTGVYAALLVSGVIPPQPLSSETPPFVIPFAALAVMLAVVSFVLPKVIYRQVATKIDVRIEEEPVPEVFAAGYRQAAPERKVFADPEAAARKAVVCFQTPFILSIALSEAAALLGFVLGFLGFPAPTWAPFMIGGAALIAMRFPTKEQVLSRFEAALGASFPEKRQ